jgi:predicted RNA-binding protein associated with RNAse of E/G family
MRSHSLEECSRRHSVGEIAILDVDELEAIARAGLFPDHLLDGMA